MRLALTSYCTTHQEANYSTTQAHQKTSYHKATNQENPKTTSYPKTHRQATCGANHSKISDLVTGTHQTTTD
ncbi:GM20192 [Drosophila sechellia]|uniref:GM20192 n=1 Tax=Drosophila sechellia TaxID=7238 RepID=B4HRN3_DROSE|nr:GM20192 [Drosophila sechellia]